MYMYRILHELTFNLNFCENSLENVIKPAFECYIIFLRTSFRTININITTSVRFLLSHDFAAHFRAWILFIPGLLHVSY